MGRSRFGKQNTRNAILDLDSYGADDMLADLGDHRHRNLPLGGAIVFGLPPAPNAGKFGNKLAQVAEQNTEIAAAWGSLYNPELDEARDDGLGTGQMHRVGTNFRPNQGALTGGRGGRGRRARSLSPRRAGRGRGLALGQLGVQMGTRPPKGPNIARFAPHLVSADPSMRHVRPRVNIPALDDMAAPSPLPLSKPARAPLRGDASDSQVGHWWGGRLCVNRDVDSFFHRSKSPKTLVASSLKVVQRDLDTANCQSKLRPRQGLEVSIQGPKPQGDENDHPPKKDRTPTPPPGIGEWVKPPPPPPSIGEWVKPPPPPGDGEWVKPPPPLTPEEPMALSERQRQQMFAAPSVTHSRVSRKQESLSIPPNSTLPPSPLSRQGSFLEKDPETIEECRNRIEQLEDVIGSASVLLSKYSEDLDETLQEEDMVLRKLEMIRETKNTQESRIAKQRNFMDQKKIELVATRKIRADLLEKLERVQRDKEERERLARAQVEDELQKLTREKKALEQARIQKEFISRQIAQTKAYKEKLLEEQRQKQEKVRLENERLGNDKERLEAEQRQKERLEREALEREFLERLHLENERLDKERLEKELLEKECLEKELLEKERLEKERLAKEFINKELLEQEKMRLEGARFEKEQIENDRLKRARLEKERIERERLEKNRLEQQQRAEEERRARQHHIEQEHPWNRHTQFGGLAAWTQPVTLKPVQVFSPAQRNVERDNAAFEAANPIHPEDELRHLAMFPLKLRMVLRPIVDLDPLEMTFNHTDQPSQRVRRVLMGILSPDDYEYLTNLTAWNHYMNTITSRFYGRMALVLGGR